MKHRVYRHDPLTPAERDEFEDDLVSFCDGELDLLGDIAGLDVLYAGGVSLLWIEGLSQRVGEAGSVAAFDLDRARVEAAREAIRDADLPGPVRLAVGSVFGRPFGGDVFDLAYSAGLFHELDVGRGSADGALTALKETVRPGGRVATGDFVDVVDAAQLEDEALKAELSRASSGAELFGIGPPERLVRLHEKVLEEVRWSVSPPYEIRHLGKVVLAEEEPEELHRQPRHVVRRLRGRREAVRDRIRREGYTRPATLFVEGRVRGGRAPE